MDQGFSPSMKTCISAPISNPSESILIGIISALQAEAWLRQCLFLNDSVLHFPGVDRHIDVVLVGDYRAAVVVVVCAVWIVCIIEVELVNT